MPESTTPVRQTLHTPTDNCEVCGQRTPAATSFVWRDVNALIAAYWCHPCRRVWQTAWDIDFISGGA
jgi:hypothetical protein